MNPVIDKEGTKLWYDAEGRPHRADGPAVEWANGTNVWYLNGLCHRTDGPAIEYANGNKAWYLNGVLHRTDGPAVEHANGKAWYLDGTELSEDLFLKLTGPVKNLPLYLGMGFDLFISERLKT
jgi:hypothetical protein